MDRHTAIHPQTHQPDLAVKERVNILLIDDQPGKLLSYEAILSGLDENLFKAHSANEALECLLKTDVALVLMDVNMPETDGFQLADTIRRHPRFQDIAIIFVSAIHRTDLDTLKGYEYGAVDYIAIPVVPELLRARVRVFAELHRKTRQLAAVNREMRDLTARMIALQDEERHRVAREMHDGIGQELSAAKMVVDGIQFTDNLPKAKAQAGEAAAMIENAIVQVRNICYLLHPPMLDELGLSAAMGWYLEGFSKRSGIQTSLDFRPTDFPRLAADLEAALYRIVQEALTNVFRHSRAQTASVSFEKYDSRVVVSVRDDGTGVAEQIVNFRPGSIGVGISGMRQRLKEFGGVLRLRNMNPGTLVEVVVALDVTAGRVADP